MARLAPSDAARLKLKWAFGFPGATRSVAQPTIFGGRVFVGSQNGKVYALDAKSGCAYWQFEAGKPVRSAIVIGPRGDNWAAYFGDAGANVYAIDALTGKMLWTTKVDQHPAAIITGSPTLVGTTLFVPVSSYEEAKARDASYGCCTFRGSVVALDAASGKIVWKTYTIAQEAKPGPLNAAGVQLMGPSGAAIWSAPTYDSAIQKLYVTTGDNYSDPPTETSDAFLALGAGSGELVWTRQITSEDAFTMACPKGINCPKSNGPDVDFGSSAVLANLPNGKRVLVAGQKSGVVTALDPDHGGEIVWQKRVGNGSTLGGVQWGVAADQDNLYVAVSDPKFHPVGPTVPGAQPFGSGVSLLIDSKAGGGLWALKLETGEEVWRTPHPGCGDVPGCSPAQSAAVTAIPGSCSPAASTDIFARIRARTGRSSGTWTPKATIPQSMALRPRAARLMAEEPLSSMAWSTSRQGQGSSAPPLATSCSHTLSTGYDRFRGKRSFHESAAARRFVSGRVEFTVVERYGRRRYD